MDRPLVILGYGLRLRCLTLSFSANDHEHQESKEKCVSCVLLGLGRSGVCGRVGRKNRVTM